MRIRKSLIVRGEYRFRNTDTNRVLRCLINKEIKHNLYTSVSELITQRRHNIPTKHNSHTNRKGEEHVRMLHKYYKEQLDFNIT